MGAGRCGGPLVRYVKKCAVAPHWLFGTTTQQHTFDVYVYVPAFGAVSPNCR